MVNVCCSLPEKPKCSQEAGSPCEVNFFKMNIIQNLHAYLLKPYMVDSLRAQVHSGLIHLMQEIQNQYTIKETQEPKRVLWGPPSKITSRNRYKRF